MARIVILTEGKSNPDSAKTATGLLRYRAGDVVAVLDSERAGERCQDVFGCGGEIPIVARLSDVPASLRPDTLLVGIAPAGGALPPPWRKVLKEAIRRRMDLVSGLHYFLSEDAELRRLAARHKVKLHDVRRPPPELTVSADLARRTACHRIHTVGHDCSVGKMVAGIELTNALTSRGRKAEFVATGQTGMLVAGWGVPIDRVISDFVAGAIETLILEHQDQEFLLIEGQGSLIHPFYSGVTLGLLHGCAPQSMIMVFDPTRKRIKHTDRAMPPLREVIRIYEEMASILAPSRVIAVAANTYKLDGAEAEAAVKRTEDELGIVTADLLRQGSDRIVAAILERHAELGLERPGVAKARARAAAEPRAGGGHGPTGRKSRPARRRRAS